VLEISVLAVRLATVAVFLVGAAFGWWARGARKAAAPAVTPIERSHLH
jgi:hypothetical protein